MSRSGCSTIPASSAPAGTKKTGAGQRSRRRSPLRIADPISLRVDVRMAPKYHPTPLSGGDRKVLAKELGKVRAMANILATRSAEMRTKGEALIQQADKLLSESWNERMWSDGEPIDTSPTVDQAVNRGFPWLEIRCARCKTPSDVDLAAMKHPPTTFVHDLASRLRCRKCAKAGRRPSATLLQWAWQPRSPRTEA
ncbi:phage FluMu protein Com [Bradyrhizobium sp. LB8.2]